MSQRSVPEYNEFIWLGDIDAVEERLVRVEEIDAFTRRSRSARNSTRAGRKSSESEVADRNTWRSSSQGLRTVRERSRKTCAEVTRTVPGGTDRGSVRGAGSREGVRRGWRFGIDQRKTSRFSTDPEGGWRDVARNSKALGSSSRSSSSSATPASKDRHWAKLSEDLGFAANGKDPNFTLQKAQLDLKRTSRRSREVSESASKEYSLEFLDKMQKDWTGVVFERKGVEETGSYILNATDEIQILLDDQVVKAMAMKASPYIGPFEDRAKQWEKTLLTIQRCSTAGSSARTAGCI